jgi:hypothetical protein
MLLLNGFFYAAAVVLAIAPASVSVDLTTPVSYRSPPTTDRQTAAAVLLVSQKAAERVARDGP